MHCVFGNTFVCTTSEVARKLAYNDNIRVKCVNLDGDVFDPSGTMTGGANFKQESILVKVQELNMLQERIRSIRMSISENKGELQKSLDNFKHFADEFNACGGITKKNGIRFAYHNHDYSFKAMDGIVPQDLMMQSTNPATVDFEMDMYWTVAAGVDPIAYMKKFPNRFKLVHVKDLAKTATGHESCIIGKGTIDYKSLLPQAAAQGVAYYIVEQEAYTGTTELDCAKEDAAYLKTLQW